MTEFLDTLQLTESHILRKEKIEVFMPEHKQKGTLWNGALALPSISGDNFVLLYEIKQKRRNIT